MGRLLDENSYVNNAAFDFEQKLDSKFARLQDKNPTPTVYYNINDPESSVDDGLYEVERPLGTHSPTRYNKIDDLPIYIDSHVLLDLQDDDEGITTSFDADGYILPGTVIPYPDDYFYIKYLGKKFIFRVTEIAYDTIKSYNYYKINFTIKSVDSIDTYQDLEIQTVSRYNCIIRNIGTEEKWLLEDDDFKAIKSLNKIYDFISDMYIKLFYIPNYNTLMYRDGEGRDIYDRYMTHFINKNGIFDRKYDYDTTELSEIDFDRFFYIDYDRCFYKMLEVGKLDKVKNIPYLLTPIMDKLCIFHIYGATNVSSVMFMDSNVGEWYLPKSIMPANREIDNGAGTPPGGSVPSTEEEDIEKLPISKKLVVKFFKGELKSVRDIPISEMNSISFIDYNWDSFVGIPLLLFTLRSVYRDFMREKQK